MEFAFLFQGFLIGLSVAAPIGVMGLLCINRTLVQGRLSGFISGLGAATAHGLYGCIAGFGLTFISDFLIDEQFHIRLIGGIFLYYLGVKTFIRQPRQEKSAIEARTLVNSYLSSFSIAITNPLTILSFAAVFAASGIAETNNYGSSTALVFGVFLGSTCWWLVLSCSVGLLRSQFNSQALQLVNRISGIMILFFGFMVLYQLLIDWSN